MRMMISVVAGLAIASLVTGCATQRTSRDYYGNRVPSKGHVLLSARTTNKSLLTTPVYQEVNGERKWLKGLRTGTFSSWGINAGYPLEILAAAPSGKAKFWVAESTEPLLVDVYASMTTRVSIVFSDPIPTKHGSTRYSVSYEIDAPPGKVSVKPASNMLAGFEVSVAASSVKAKGAVGVNSYLNRSEGMLVATAPDMKTLVAVVESVQQAASIAPGRQFIATLQTNSLFLQAAPRANIRMFRIVDNAPQFVLNHNTILFALGNSSQEELLALEEWIRSECNEGNVSTASDLLHILKANTARAPKDKKGRVIVDEQVLDIAP